MCWFILIMEQLHNTTANERSNKVKQAFKLVVILAEALHNDIHSLTEVLLQWTNCPVQFYNDGHLQGGF